MSMRTFRQLVRLPLAWAVCGVPKRFQSTGHFPVSGEGGTAGWTLPRTHHLTASAGVHSVVHTACGRPFDPNVYYEMLQACCDQQWLQAIQKGLVEDKEYMDMLRTEGGCATTIDAMSRNVHHDDEFMNMLKDKLATDRRVALTLCAMQESYTRIRSKRDRHETQAAADGHDPYAPLKKQRASFGQQVPSF